MNHMNDNFDEFKLDECKLITSKNLDSMDPTTEEHNFEAHFQSHLIDKHIEDELLLSDFKFNKDDKGVNRTNLLIELAYAHESSNSLSGNPEACLRNISNATTDVSTIMLRSEQNEKPKGESQNKRNLNYFLCNFEGCQYKSPKKYNLKRHMNSHLSKDAQIFFKCPFVKCKHKTTRQDNLRLHLLTHEQSDQIYRCSTCDFEEYEILTIHDHINRFHPIDEGDINASSTPTTILISGPIKEKQLELLGAVTLPELNTRNPNAVPTLNSALRYHIYCASGIVGGSSTTNNIMMMPQYHSTLTMPHHSIPGIGHNIPGSSNELMQIDMPATRINIHPYHCPIVTATPCSTAARDAGEHQQALLQNHLRYSTHISPNHHNQYVLENINSFNMHHVDAVASPPTIPPFIQQPPLDPME